MFVEDCNESYISVLSNVMVVDVLVVEMKIVYNWLWIYWIKILLNEVKLN